MYEIKSCDFIYQHIGKHHIPQKYDSFLDLLSKNIKTNRNKRVFFAVKFLTERIMKKYIIGILMDASIHQYDVSSRLDSTAVKSDEFRCLLMTFSRSDTIPALSKARIAPPACSKTKFAL